MECNKCKNKMTMHSFYYFKCRICGKEVLSNDISGKEICLKCSEEKGICEICGDEIKGRLIFIEAVDCAGKTTQVNLLKEKLGDKIKVYREPGGTHNAELIRETLFKMVGTSNKTTDAYLFAAARSELYTQIKEDIENGKIVICDRSYISSYVYQGKIAENINKEAVSFLKSFVEPEFILLDISDKEVLVNRMNLRGEMDALEKELIDKFDQQRKAYLNYIEKIGTVIDASSDIETVNNKLLTVLNIR